MITILAFGNEYLQMDSLAKKIAPKLRDRNVKVFMCDSPEEITLHKPPIVILDVAEGITKPTLLKVEQLENSRIYSLHDFDLAYFLKLMKEMNELNEKDITIIALPMDKEPEIEEIRRLLPVDPEEVS